MSVISLRIVDMSHPLAGAAGGIVRQRSQLGIYALTVARLLLAFATLGLYQHGWGAAAIAVLTAFVVSDVLDGVLARKRGQETRLRRGLDGAVDKISIHVVVAAVCLALPGGIWIWLSLLLRDVVQAVLGAVLYLRFRVVAAGAGWHRAYALAIAAWGAVVLASRELQWILALPALILGVITLIDYARQCRMYATAHRGSASRAAQI